jgi:DNA-binding transcriptional MerR regulator
MNPATVYIPEKLFFKIGEVCDITGIQAHVLRYWESEFPTLAPQKNRAGQRTYRKRDVEMVLRIKELLYDDQYTIAGAKKRLTNEIRGASKLKVVTPEMGAQGANSQTLPQLVTTEPLIEESTDAYADSHDESHEQAVYQHEEPKLAMTDERRAAIRRLREQLRDVLTLLGSKESQPRSPRR